MTLDQIADVIDVWEAHWPEERRFWRIAKADLVWRVLQASGSGITGDAVPVDEARKDAPHLAAFLDRWDAVFAARRVDFVVELAELLMKENQRFTLNIMRKLRDKARD